MATCIHCFSKKPFWASVCHSCNNNTPFTQQLFAQIIVAVGMLTGFFLPLFILHWIMN